MVGGVAVSYYVPSRIADDLDLMIDPHTENVRATISALHSIGLPCPFTAEQFAKPKVQLPLKGVQYADIVTPAEELNFQHAYSIAESARLNGVSVKLAAIETLLQTKATDREQDLKDAQLLLNWRDTKQNSD